MMWHMRVHIICTGTYVWWRCVCICVCPIHTYTYKNASN